MLNFKKNFFISEIGINHGGNFDTALKLIKVSKKVGFNAVKFQTYTTEKRVKKNSPIFNILKKCELSYEEFAELKKFCDKSKIIFFSTPFDPGAVHFLNKIRVKLFKIASFDISNLELIRAVKNTKKPCIISTGMASKKEINTVYNLFRNNLKNLILLHCISSYPCKEEDSFLQNINIMKSNYNCEIGLSDHTPNIKTSIIAKAMGVNIFEKHFKLQNQKCVDEAVSIDPKKFIELRHEAILIDKIKGNGKFGLKRAEKFAKQFKRYSK
jgi:N,N'-diacetyllegionaminate synthase